MADKVKIRTTVRPDEEVEISPEEALDLRRMGLVADTKATTAKGARRAVQRQQAAPRKKAAAKTTAATPPANAGTAAVAPTSQEG